MKWILIALLLLAVAFIVYAVVGRRDAAADTEAATDLRDRGPSGADVPTEDAAAPAAEEYATETGRPVDTRSTIFDDPEPASQPAEARPADAATAPTASTEPEEGDMFGWGKDKDKDEHDDAVEASRVDDNGATIDTAAERTETHSEDYVPRRGAGVDDEDRVDGGVRGDASDADQPMWTTSAHDPDHTVAEERTEGGRTRFDEDVATTAEDDRVEESQEGAFQPTGGDDVVDDPRPGDGAGRDTADLKDEQPVEDDGEGRGATAVRAEQPVDDERRSATDVQAEQPVEQDEEAQANASSAADPDAAAQAGDGAPRGVATGADDAAGALDDDDAGVAPGEAQADDSEAAARGSREAYEAGQASAGGASEDGSGDRSDDVSRDDDALEGATDGSAGARALDGSGREEHTDSHDDTGSQGDADSHDDADERHEPSGDEGGDGHEEPADPAEFRQPGDWVADEEGGPEVQTAQDAAELRGGPTRLDDGAVAGPEGDSDTGEGGGGGSRDEGDRADASSQAAGEHEGGDGEQDAADSADAGDGQGWTRRVSGLDEIRDGGYGVGSAATFEDHAMPLGHPVKAWEDTKTYVDESHPSYGDAEPHVWFTDQEAAERAGFRRVD